MRAVYCTLDEAACSHLVRRICKTLRLLHYATTSTGYSPITWSMQTPIRLGEWQMSSRSVGQEESSQASTESAGQRFFWVVQTTFIYTPTPALQHLRSHQRHLLDQVCRDRRLR